MNGQKLSAPESSVNDPIVKALPDRREVTFSIVDKRIEGEPPGNRTTNLLIKSQ